MHTRILADKIRNKKCFSERYSVPTRLDFFKPSERRYPCTKSPAFTNSACCSIVHFCRCNTHVSAGCQLSSRCRSGRVSLLQYACECGLPALSRLHQHPAKYRCNTHVSAGCQGQPFPLCSQQGQLQYACECGLPV